MEKISAWRWRLPSGQQREDAFWFQVEDGWVYITRGDEPAAKAYPGKWMQESLSRKPAAQLAAHMRNALDFLNARLTGEETYSIDWIYQTSIGRN